MARAYILTEREREILERFMKTGEKLNGFAVLVHYLKKAVPQLKEDWTLLTSVLEKVKAE